MNSQKLVPLIIRYSGFTSLAFLAYFLLMKLLNLETIVELRLLNFFIMLLGIRFFLLRLKREHDGRLEYLQSLGYGLWLRFLLLYFSQLSCLYTLPTLTML